MHHNDILARLHQSHPDFVTRRARQITYVHGDVFGEAGRPIDELLFPSSGMISLVVDCGGYLDLSFQSPGRVNTREA